MTYDFKCLTCGNTRELAFRISQVPKQVECDKCKQVMEQFISGDNPFILKNKGWYKPAHHD